MSDEKTKHTPGPVSITQPPSGDPYLLILRVVSESTNIDICDLRCDATDEEAVAVTRLDANIIAQAFNVSERTSRQPEQLEAERNTLLDLAKETFRISCRRSEGKGKWSDRDQRHHEATRAALVAAIGEEAVLAIAEDRE